MHITKIEEFSFDHGQHFNTATGEYHSLNPHTLGRPLTHTEMDYNLIYQKQTLNGFRICGSNNDLTLALSDLGARLEFTRISSSDADWARFQAAGLFNGQFVWNPVGGALPATTTTTAAPTTTSTTTTSTTTSTTTAAPTTTTTTTAAPTTTSTTTTTTAAPTTTTSTTSTTTTTTSTTTTTAAPTYSLSVNGPVNEGGNMVFTLTTTDLNDGDVVPFALAGTATIGVDYSDVNPKEFVIANNSATYTVTTFADNTTEGGGNETIKLPLAAFDSQGNGTFSETVTGEIVDTSQTPTTTTTTTTAAPELAYFFHLGNGTYPYAQDLIGGTWYKADNSVAADFAEGFADALANPGSYETINSVSSISSGDQFVFPASQAQNFFWLLIPDSYGIPDLTGVARLADTQNNINDVAAQVLATTVNGQPYKLYRVNLAQALAGVTIQYNE